MVLRSGRDRSRHPSARLGALAGTGPSLPDNDFDAPVPGLGHPVRGGYQGIALPLVVDGDLLRVRPPGHQLLANRLGALE